MLIGVGAIQWARKLMSDVEIVEYRHSAGSVEEDREDGGRRAAARAPTTPASADGR